MTIHSDDPFSVPTELREPARRLRGRLAAPVTILTAQDERPAGLTVSSFFVVEGTPHRAAALIGLGSDLLIASEASGGFVAHILTESDRDLAEVFAGLRPAPGGMFRSIDTEPSSWGPRISRLANWAGCRLEEVRALGEQLLVVGIIEELAVSDLSDPLVYFRGAYRRLEP